MHLNLCYIKYLERKSCPIYINISWTYCNSTKAGSINFSCALCQVRSKRTKQAGVRQKLLVQAFLKQGKLCKSIWYKEHSANTLMCTQDQARAWKSWCRGQQRNAFKKKKDLFINIFTLYGFFSWQESKSCPCLLTLSLCALLAKTLVLSMSWLWCASRSCLP